MAAAVKKRRVVARVTLTAGEPGKPLEVPPGQETDIEAGEAEALVRRGFAAWPPAGKPKADNPGLPLDGGGPADPDADA